MNVDKLQEYTDKVNEHATHYDGSIALIESRDGLASVLTGECSNCQHTLTLETSKKVRGPRGYNR